MMVLSKALLLTEVSKASHMLYSEPYSHAEDGQA